MTKRYQYQLFRKKKKEKPTPKPFHKHQNSQCAIIWSNECKLDCLCYTNCQSKLTTHLKTKNLLCAKCWRLGTVPVDPSGAGGQYNGHVYFQRCASAQIVGLWRVQMATSNIHLLKHNHFTMWRDLAPPQSFSRWFSWWANLGSYFCDY